MLSKIFFLSRMIFARGKNEAKKKLIFKEHHILEPPKTSHAAWKDVVRLKDFQRKLWKGKEEKRESSKIQNPVKLH